MALNLSILAVKNLGTIFIFMFCFSSRSITSFIYYSFLLPKKYCHFSSSPLPLFHVGHHHVSQGLMQECLTSLLAWRCALSSPISRRNPSHLYNTNLIMFNGLIKQFGCLSRDLVINSKYFKRLSRSFLI